MRSLLLLASSLALVPACADSSSSEELPPPDANADPNEVPTDRDALLPWLLAEPYLEWPAESAIHDSTGPHFGNVRTWVSPDLFSSLEDGEAQHPVGAAAVKELYGAGNDRRGWAVGVKIADAGPGEDGWYWYEWFDGGVVAEGNAISLCSGCHSGGLDFVLTPFPLQ